MSNQIFSNATDLYPIIYTSQAVKGGGIGGGGDYIDLNTSNVVRGNSLVITDDSGAGTFASPYIGKFVDQVRVSQSNAIVNAPAGAVTQLYQIPFVGLLDGNWMIETYLKISNGAVATDQLYAILERYSLNGGADVTYNTNNTVLFVAQSGQAQQFYTRQVINMPDAGAGTLELKCLYSSVATANADSVSYNVKMTYLGN